MWLGGYPPRSRWCHFIDLRDRDGIVQVVFDPDANSSFELANRVRSEFVLQVRGKVRPHAQHGQ